MTKKRGMRGLGDETARETDEVLGDEEARLLVRSQTNLQALKPSISDGESFEKLLEAVRVSTARNESVAQFQARIKALGKNVEKVAALAAKLVAS